MAPDSDGGVNAESILEIYPDLNKPAFAKEYGDGSSYDAKTVKIMRDMAKNPAGEITVYRAVPSGTNAGQLNYGDWVAITKDYADEHGQARFNGDYKVIEQKVKTADVYTDGNSIHEWGYAPKSDPIYQARQTLKTEIADLNNRLDAGDYRSPVTMNDVLAGDEILKDKPSIAKLFLDSKNQEVKPAYQKNSLTPELIAMADQVKGVQDRFDLMDIS